MGDVSQTAGRPAQRADPRAVQHGPRRRGGAGRRGADRTIRLARERDARVVVVGAHEHAGLLGSMTRRVIREAPCPTLVVGERLAG